MQSTERFAFGQNWQAYLEKGFTPERLAAARRTLADTVGDLSGKTFLDVGSGSGLHAIAAESLGARVTAFDYDPDSVAATASLAEGRFTVTQASVLDAGFMRGLGRFDVVYCWGVAHHTGSMWRALELLADAVKPGGTLVLAIYNDQGTPSRRWLVVKRLYNRFPMLRPLLLAGAFVRIWGVKCAADLLRGRPFHRWRHYVGDVRGMSAWHDLKDWTGGYPFEVAKPEQIFDFYRQRGFELQRLQTQAGGIGCNEYVFRYTSRA
jgi:2-polyprenyl-6-hydroxyphenyl methylase/3-demethylubiquinone-9 3-methyltransferase